MIDRETADVLGARLTRRAGRDSVRAHLFEIAPDRTVHPAVPRAAAPRIGRGAAAARCALLSRAAICRCGTRWSGSCTIRALEVRTEALLYLTEHAHIDPLTLIEQLGDFPDFSIRAAMVAFLARPGRAAEHRRGAR